MVHPAPIFSPNSILELGPVAKSKLVGQADEEDVCLTAEVLALLCGAVEVHVFVWILIETDLLCNQTWGSHVEVDILLGLVDL